MLSILPARVHDSAPAGQGYRKSGSGQGRRLTFDPQPDATTHSESLPASKRARDRRVIRKRRSSVLCTPRPAEPVAHRGTFAPPRQVDRPAAALVGGRAARVGTPATAWSRRNRLAVTASTMGAAMDASECVPATPADRADRHPLRWAPCE